MRLALVSPITSEADFSNQSNAEPWNGYEPPLGILTLAAILRTHGTQPVVFDLDGFIREGVARRERLQDAFHSAAQTIAAIDVDLFGFGSICGSYPLLLRLVREIHRLRPDARFVLGGPQASVVDIATMNEFDCIDAIVRGEADQVIVPALEQIARIASIQEITVAGVTWRRDGQVIRNSDQSVVTDLDAVPPPAFDLCRHLDRCSFLPIEIGRGCPFACTFCSTNDFFRRRFRLRSPNCVLREMRRLHSLYGVTSFDFVHDMFTVDRKRVIEFCRHIEAGGDNFTWRVSARTDFVDAELIEILRAGGCHGIFFGVETGSPRMQRIIGKDLCIEEADRAIELSHAAGIPSTASLIVGYPEETREDLRQTVEFAFRAARFRTCKVQIGLLAALAGTPLYRQWSGKLFFDGLLPEHSSGGCAQDAEDKDLIARHPVLFSNFYGLPTAVGREYCSQVHWFISFSILQCRWLAAALALQFDALEICDAWLEWGEAGRRPRAYYETLEFAQEFCRFALDFAAGKTVSSDLVGLAARYYASLHDALQGPPPVRDLPQSAWPVMRPNISMADLSFRPSDLFDAIRHWRQPDRSCFERATVVFRREGDEVVEIRELSPLAADIVRVCDGRTSFDQMADLLRAGGHSFHGLTAEQFLPFGLDALERDGLIANFAQHHPAVPELMAD